MVENTGAVARHGAQRRLRRPPVPAVETRFPLHRKGELGRIRRVAGRLFETSVVAIGPGSRGFGRHRRWGI
jgi:hypothetical protein